MSQNRHTSSLRKFHKPGKKRKSANHSNGMSYEALESKQLLAADLLVNFETGSFNGQQDVNIGVGPNHIVQVDDNNFSVYSIADLEMGVTTPEFTTDLDSFWTDNAFADAEMVSNTSNPKVVYDADTRRWFIIAHSDADIITGQGAENQDNPVLVAVSRSQDPTDPWVSMADFYDHDNDLVNGNGNPPTPLLRRDGGFLPGRFRQGSAVIAWDTELAVDEHNIYVSVSVGTFARTYAFNKFETLVVPQPFNPWAFDGGAPLFGADPGFEIDPQTQWNQDVYGNVAGTFGLSTAANGVTNQITLYELSDTGISQGATLEPAIQIPVDPFEEPSRDVRQFNGPDILNAGTTLNNAVVRNGNSLWAAHAIKGSFPAPNPDGGIEFNSAIRVYEIDLDAKIVRQSFTIEKEFTNFIYPTMSVTQEGHVVVAYTATGVDPADPLDAFNPLNISPTAMVSIGYENNGTVLFEEPLAVKSADGPYFDAAGNFFGSQANVVNDPDEFDKVWVVSQWSAGGGTVSGRNQLTQITLTGHTAVLSGDANDNEIVVRRSALDPTQIEIVIDNIVVQSYEEDVLFDLQISGGGGDDTFVIDTSNGEIDIDDVINFIGDGDDQVIMRTTERTNWEVFIDGTGQANVGTNLPSNFDIVPTISQEFVLNYEANSGWFDTTPYTDSADPSITNRGEALRADLEGFLDTYTTLFANSFSLELDIDDDEVGILSSATPLGEAIVDINGSGYTTHSPWSIMTGRGDTNGADSDGILSFNLDLDLYQGDFEALRDNIRTGLTRFTMSKLLGMSSGIDNQTPTNDPRGDRISATVMDLYLRDLNDAPLIGNFSAGDSMFDVLNYQTNASLSGDNSGIYFLGIDDNGDPIQLPVNSNSELINFSTLASAFAGTSRDGRFEDIIEQDRSFLRGIGIELNPIVPVQDLPGQAVTFGGVDQIWGGDGQDSFGVRSSNVDLEIRGGIGNDVFNVTGLGAGALDLLGQQGDDIYQIVFSPNGIVTVIDSVNNENDTIIGLGTTVNDTFVFDTDGIEINDGTLVYVGVENVTFNGREGDDTFQIVGDVGQDIGLDGGAGNDTFTVDGTGNSLFVSVNDPLVDPVDQLRLDVTGSFNSTYFSDNVENLQIDGIFYVDGVRGTPTVAGGLNLVGGGDEILVIRNSTIAANWTISSDAAGDVVMDVEPMTFSGINSILAGVGIDTFAVNNTDVDMSIDGGIGEDQFTVNNSGTGFLNIDGGNGNDLFNVLNSGGGVDLFGNTGRDIFVYDDVGTGTGLLRGGISHDTFTINSSSTATVDVLGQDGNDIVTVLNSGGGITINTAAGTDEVIYNNVGATAGTIDTGSENDIVTVLNSGSSSTLDINLGSGEDTFTMNSPTGSSVTNVLSGTEDDTFNVVNSGLGNLTLGGQEGDDTYNVTFVDPSIDFVISDSPNAENDTLNILGGTAGDDQFVITPGSFTFNGRWMVTGIENFGFDGGDGNDTFDVDLGNSWNGNLTLVGSNGNDTFNIANSGMGVIDLDGVEGDDTYNVTILANTDVRIFDTGLSGNDTFNGFGTANGETFEIFLDSVSVGGGTVTYGGVEVVGVDGLGGDDTMNVRSTIANTTVSGGSDNDILNVRDSATDGNAFLGGSGDDTFNVELGNVIATYNGNEGNDIFTIIATGGGGTFLGESGTDQFQVGAAVGDSILDGGADNDFFEINNNVLALGSVGSLQIDGGGGVNEMLVNGYQTQANFATITSSEITGMSAVPIQYSSTGGTFNKPDDSAGGITLIGSDNHDDSMQVFSFDADDSLLMLGGNGGDFFFVAMEALGKIASDGQEGSDLYRYNIGSEDNRFLFATDTGIADQDRIIAVLSENDDVLNLSGESFLVNTDNFGFNMNFESMIVATQGGNDTVNINRLSLDFLRVTTGDGDDNVNINNFAGVSSILIQGDGGNDTVFVDSGTVDGTLNAFGGSGDDTFVISPRTYGNNFLDGEDGNDVYDISFADRSNRFVVAIDSGTTGTDTMMAKGTILDDRMNLRVNAVQSAAQFIYYTDSIESTSVFAGGSSDVISVFGISSAETNLNAEDGNDLVFVNSTFGEGPSKQFNVNLGRGNDFATISGTNPNTTTSILGNDGDDQINLGSSFEDNNGNLDVLYGAIHVEGNGGNDFVYVNDAGKGSSFNYALTPNSLTNNGSPSNFFGGITFNSTVETLRLDATNFRNDILVTPSTDTAFILFGNGGFNTIGLTEDQDGDGRQFFGENGGNGFWTFEDGSLDIYFEDFFLS